MTRRIGLLTASASRLNGGVFEAVVAQAALLAREGFAPQVFALEDAHSGRDRSRFGDVPVQVFPVAGPRAIGYAPGLLPALLAADLDLLHLHGIWMYPSHAGSRWAARTGRPYVISPHGMLDPWITGRGRLKKAIARAGYERASWHRARLFHALTQAEASDIRREAGASAEIAVVPNAVEGTTGAPDRAPTIVFLGRIHPKKNVTTLVDAWQRVAAGKRFPGARLVIAGWGDPQHVAALEAQIVTLPDDAGVSFVGPAYGMEKAALLGEARFFALPSHSEGLPVAVLEAWAAGTPSLMSTHCNLPQGFAQGAAIDCGTDIDTVAAAIERALTMPPAVWNAMSDAALTLADTFSLERVGQRWGTLLRDMIEPHSDATPVAGTGGTAA